MRPAFFLITFFIILAPYHSTPRASAQSQTVTVSAFVDENLTYFINGNGLIISTNSRAQYLILSPAGDIISQVSGPIDQQTIHLADKNFILVAQL